jgi:rubrerythrin
MSTNDNLAQMPPLSQFDLAIIKTLRKNPQGLRYRELLRKSGEEYGRMNRDKGINEKTFDKHLKWLVSERALERIEEKRYRVFYRLMIPEDSFPKKYVEAYRDQVAKNLNKLRELEHLDGFDRSAESIAHASIEPLIDGLVLPTKLTLLLAIQANQINPAWARYLVDESMETDRNLFNGIVGAYGKLENSRNLLRLMNRLRLKWAKQLKCAAERLLQPFWTCENCGEYYSKTHDKCPHCGTLRGVISTGKE